MPRWNNFRHFENFLYIMLAIEYPKWLHMPSNKSTNSLSYLETFIPKKFAGNFLSLHLVSVCMPILFLEDSSNTFSNIVKKGRNKQLCCPSSFVAPSKFMTNINCLFTHSLSMNPYITLSVPFSALLTLF